MYGKALVGMLIWGLAAAGAAGGMQDLGVEVPAPELWRFTALAADGAGTVYAVEDDTLFRLDGGAFQPLVADFGQQAWPGQDMTVDPSGFAVTPDGTTAYVATGGTGRLVEIDIDASSGTFGTAREVTGARMQSNYGLAVDPLAGGVYLTDSFTGDLYAAEVGGAGSLTQVTTFATGMWGGGLGFSPDGDLMLPLAVGFGSGDEFVIDLWQFGRDVFDTLAAGTVPADPGQKVAAGLAVSGTGFVVADAEGNTYLQAADGIYRVDPAGDLSVLVGDTSLDVFTDLVGKGFMGLAYDAPANRLLFAYRETDTVPWSLHAYPVPGPATLTLLGAGLALAASRRRRG